MQFREIAASSTQALKSNLLRTALTVLGIVIGISSVILISSIGQGAVAFITDQLSVFGSNFFRVAAGENAISAFAGTKNPITTQDAQALKDSSIPNLEHVVSISISTRNVTSGDQQTTTSIHGMDAEAQFILKPELIYGEFLSSTDIQNATKVAVVGESIATDFFGPDSNPVGQSIRIDNTRFRIIGVSKAAGAFGSIFNNGINIPVSTMNRDITGVDELLEIIISVKNKDQLNQTITDVEDFLREFRGIQDDEDNDFFAQSFADALDIITTITTLLTLMITGISGISLVVGGVGIMNIMLVSVTERTREIGLLKAIGARNQDILTQFIVESITLSLAGGFIGISLGLLGAFGISQLIHIPFIVSPVAIITAASVSTLVGLIFGYYPARRAAGLDPITALRFQ